MIQVKVLGCRGSMPTGGQDTALFGGDTSCYEVRAGEDLIYLDAGSGLARADTQGTKEIHLLLTHGHLDHIIGFAFFPALRDASCRIHVYGCAREGLTPEEQMRRLYAPPLWPVWSGDDPAEVRFHDLREAGSMEIGGVQVDWIPSAHPGGSALYRRRREGKTLVYATDFEHGLGPREELVAFARGADLLLYDGQYTPEEYARYAGFGHSTAEEGMRIAAESGAQRIWMIHHAPRSTDEKLLAREKQLGVHFARQGDCIEI